MAKVRYELYGDELVGYLVECKLYRDELVAS